ncbi:Uncharacterized protein MCHI_000162 [Candidatus Magnetoovum chiemensis]|nr:Uncharacterized protein MCHI_000162 [Candidatus Magnetoovum chiemensis]
MKIAIELPDRYGISEVDSIFLREGLIALLYYKGKISEKDACDILGKTVREFEDILPNFGFSVLSDKKESIDIELNA